MKIYQIWYDSNSKSKLDFKGIIPYDNTVPAKPNEFEYGVMRQLYFNEETWKKNDKLGVISWKFKQKTNKHPHEFVDWIKKNSGGDIYHINPFTNMKVFNNAWEQGEHFHPGLMEVVKILFEKSNLDLELLTIPHIPKVLCYCNYWVAKKEFWDLYMSYTEPLYKSVYDTNQNLQDKLFHIKADVQINSGMFSFIFERMFSTVLAKHQTEFKIKPYYT